MSNTDKLLKKLDALIDALGFDCEEVKEYHKVSLLGTKLTRRLVK